MDGGRLPKISPTFHMQIHLSLSLSPSGRGRGRNGNFSLPENRGNCIFPVFWMFSALLSNAARVFPLLEVRREISCAKSFAGFLLFCARRQQFFKNWSVQRDLNIIEFLFLSASFFSGPSILFASKPLFFLGFDFLQYVSDPRRQSRNINVPRERERHKNALQQHLLQPLQSFPTNQRRRKFDALENLFLRNICAKHVFSPESCKGSCIP